MARAATWLDILIEKHAWLSAGLIWKPFASEFGFRSNSADTKSDELEPTPFEMWEEVHNWASLCLDVSSSFLESSDFLCLADAS